MAKKVTNIWRAYAEILETIKSLSKLRGTSKNQDQEINKFVMVIEMKNNSEKNIKIDLTKLKLIFNLKLARIAGDFFGYAEKVQVVTSTVGNFYTLKRP